MIEAGKELVRVGGNEQGVEVVRIVHVVVDADDARTRGRDCRLKVQCDLVIAIAKRGGRNDEMTMFGDRRRGNAVYHHVAVPESAKIENDVAAAMAHDAHAPMAECGVAASDVELQRVAHIGELHGAPLRQGA